MIHVGFTGTRNGMTTAQHDVVLEALDKLAQLDKLICHHGDCVGADAQFHEISVKLGAYVIIHPPAAKPGEDLFVARCRGDERRDPLNHLRRNRAIVAESRVMIAAPPTEEHQSRGGTWYTYDYTIKMRKPIMLVTPSGRAAISFDTLWPR